MSKREIKLEFEIAVQFKLPEQGAEKEAVYSIKPLHDKDFWAQIYGEDMNDFVPALNAGEDEDFALAVLSLRLHDYATGKAYAHGLDTEVPKQTTFIKSNGERKVVKVPKMQNL
jgi:hypothetical protein